MKVLEGISSCENCIYKGVMFGSLDGGELLKISTHKKELAFSKGEILFRQGDPVKEFLYLKTGLVKLYRSDERTVQIIRIAEPGDFVSLLSIFSESQYKYSIMALEDTVVCSVDIGVFKELVASNTTFSLDVLQKMSQLYDNIIENKYNLSKKHLRGRIAYILLSFSDRIYKDDTFALPVSRKEIAELIDMTPENVIRILSEFRADQLIELTGKSIKILNKESLKMISEHG